MKNYSTIFIVLLLASTLQVSTQDCTNTPKIPSYLGKGYDIVFGNPSTNTIDPGFRYEVIVFDYKDGVTTEDKKFVLPDGISFQKSQSCSYSSSVSQFRGTQSYQNDLKVNVKVGGGYDGAAVKASFTASMGYKNMEQKIEKEQTVIFQASSKCESYKLALDLFKGYKISSNFFQALDLAVNSNDWSTFISQYGTHYTTEVLFGGRAIQESEFTRTSVATLNQKGIDVGLAVKAGYAGFYGEASTDISISNQQKTEAQSLKRKTSNYYIGGVPPGKGNIQDWQIQVNNQPMPISYKVMPLSDLFGGSPGKSAPWVKSARDLFFKALDAYCVGKCSTPNPDKALPTKRSSTYAFTSSLFGGDGGGFFSWNQMVADWHISRVKVRSGSQIDGIQVYASHKNTPYTVIQSGYYGGSGGGQNIFSVQPGDWINKIVVRSGSRVDSLTFYTRRNSSPNKFGGDGGGSSIVTPPSEDYRWTGIVGKSGARLDKIGFLFTLTVWNIGHAHHITKVVYPQQQQ